MTNAVGPWGSPPLTIRSSRPRPDVLVVHVEGELDMWTTPVLEEFLLEQGGPPIEHLAVDLGDVRFLGSHGCALLLRAGTTDELVEAQLHLVCVAGNRPVERVLDLTGLATLVPVHLDEAELLAALAR
jgi:anti-anti-sigma factor